MRYLSLFTQTVLSLSFMVLAPTQSNAKVSHATHTVVIEGMKFNPPSLTVKQGDTVIWVNKDIVPHTATGQKQEFDSKEIKSSSQWKYVAKKKGEMPYVCSFHPTMKAVLTVQ